MLAYCSGCGSPLGQEPPCTCSACGHRFWDNPRPCGGAFVTHDGRLLLVQRQLEPWAGHWDVPGGFCEGHEHPEQTTRREVREETGLDITITGLLGMWMDRYGDGTSPWTLNIYYEAITDDPSRAVPRDETTAVHWFPREDLDATPLAFPSHMHQAVHAWLGAHRA